MLLIYVDKLTNRLGYTLNLLFKELMSIRYSITIDKEYFVQYDGPKFSYTTQPITDELFLLSTPLLFQTLIEITDVNYFEKNNTPYLFRIYSKDSVCDFDIFAACFYLVSRYEEYLPYVKDKHSRYKAQDSLAYKKNFLKKPVVNIWANEFKRKILERYPELYSENKKYSYINTIDIDSAYSYTCKGFNRNLFGFLRDLLRGKLSLCFERLKVLLKIEKDPYNTFDFIISLIEKHKIDTIFFVLYGGYGKYDKNITPYNNKFRILIKSLCDYAKVGVHPSYDSFDYPQLITSQTKMLKETLHKPIKRSRYHYLRFCLPEGYRNLIATGSIEHDFSMGYSDCIGFRAGICSCFNFYDLAMDYETTLKVHPFAYMDVALKNGLKLSPQQALEEIKQLNDEVKNVGGEMISIWHNESLSNKREWFGWREVYEKVIEYSYNEKIN
ncbi:MAG: polysaccharide deacetylase family protein [Bacteroidales bacterium]|nr:polysaccharide deacetylase family protein [Bacteroidales bacterium]